VNSFPFIDFLASSLGRKNLSKGTVTMAAQV